MNPAAGRVIVAMGPLGGATTLEAGPGPEAATGTEAGPETGAGTDAETGTGTGTGGGGAGAGGRDLVEASRTAISSLESWMRDTGGWMGASSFSESLLAPPTPSSPPNEWSGSDCR